MTTATQAGRSVLCGAAATVGIWSGDAIAAQRFTRRSRDRIAESATEARSRFGKTNNGVDRAAPVSPQAWPDWVGLIVVIGSQLDKEKFLISDLPILYECVSWSAVTSCVPSTDPL